MPSPFFFLTVSTQCLPLFPHTHHFFLTLSRICHALILYLFTALPPFLPLFLPHTHTHTHTQGATGPAGSQGPAGPPVSANTLYVIIISRACKVKLCLSVSG